MVLEKTPESPLDCKEIKPVNPKGNQSWVFTGRPDAEAEAPILWPPDVKSQLTGKDPNAGKDWGQEKRAAEDEIVRWHYQLNGHEFEQSLGDSGQRSLACYSRGSQRVRHDFTTEQQWTTRERVKKQRLLYLSWCSSCCQERFSCFSSSCIIWNVFVLSWYSWSWAFSGRNSVISWLICKYCCCRFFNSFSFNQKESKRVIYHISST